MLKFNKTSISLETKKWLFIIGKCFTTPKHMFGFVLYWLAPSKMPLIVKL